MKIMNMFSNFIFGLVTFMLAAPQGLSAQKDTTFIADGNPIVKYKRITKPSSNSKATGTSFTTMAASIPPAAVSAALSA